MTAHTQTYHSQLLEEFNNIYNKIMPAQENSQKAFVWLSGIAHPLFNIIVNRTVVIDQIAEIIHASQNRVPHTPISLWIEKNGSNADLNHSFISNGYMHFGSCPLMFWPVQPIGLPDTPAKIEKVATSNLTHSALMNSNTFYQILARNFELNDQIKADLSQLMSKTSIENYLIFEGSAPIGTVILVVDKKVGGVLNMSILPSYRQKGYATQLIQHLQATAFEKGLEKLILLSTPASESLYANNGFLKDLEIDILINKMTTPGLDSAHN